VTYEKIRTILEKAENSESLIDLMESIGKESSFISGRKEKKVMGKRKRKDLINKCIKLGFLDNNYKITKLGKEALQDYDRILSKAILNKRYINYTFRELLLKALSKIKIPTIEEINKQFVEFKVNIPFDELKNNINILVKCGVLNRNRKYTYTIKKISLEEFKEIIQTEYMSTEKDPTGLVWFEKFRDKIIRDYIIPPNHFDELFLKLKEKYPRLIGIQHSRTKSWLLLRER